MNRRDIMKLFGLGAAAALPVAAVSATSRTPEPAPIGHPLHKHFLEPIDAHVHMKGGNVYTYRASRYPGAHRVRVAFTAWAAGTIDKVTLSRHGVELISVPQGAMDTPFCTSGARIVVDVEARAA